MAENSAFVVPFNFDDTEIRIVMIDGEPWWVARDVCGVLGIVDVNDAVERLDEADTAKSRVRNSRGEMRESWVINESGLYDLIIRSNKPDARRFRRWITSEVLPSIRKTGRYEIEQMSSRERALALAHELIAAEAQVQAVTAELAVAAPKAIEHDAYLDTDGIASLGEVAQAFGIGRNRFIDRLRVLDVLLKRSASQGGVRPYQRFAAPDAAVPWFVVKGKTTRIGRVAETYVTSHGVSSLYRLLARRGTGRSDWALPGSVQAIRAALGWSS